MFWRCIRYLCLVLLIFTVSCSGHPSKEAQGYMEGRYTYIATPVSGVLKTLFVDRGMFVKKGEPLFVLEMQPESDAYQAALENLKQTIASRDAIAFNLAYAKITYERYQILLPKRAIDQSRLDQAKANYHALLAGLDEVDAAIASKKASLHQAKWTQDQKIISAPQNALVFDTYYRLGEYTIANQAILSLLSPSDIKAIFYVNETILGAIKLNDSIAVQCDGCSRAYSGRISFISPTAEYTPPVIFSNETNEKLVYRVEASFLPKEALNLHPGQPVTVTYYPHV